MAPNPLGDLCWPQLSMGPSSTGSYYWMPQKKIRITCPSLRSSQDPCSSDPT